MLEQQVSQAATEEKQTMRNAPAAHDNVVNRHERRWQTIWQERRWIVLVLLCALLLLYIKPCWDASPDAVGYLSMARSFATGEQMTNLSMRHLHYPPGYALLISPLFLLEENPFLLLSILQALLAGLVMLLVYYWSRPILHPVFALGLVALVACNASFIHYASMTLSEMAFTFWLFLAGMVLTRALASSAKTSAAWTILGAVLVLCAAVTRQVGIMLIPGCFCAGVVAAWRKEASWYRAFVVPLVAGLPALFALLWLMNYEAHTARLDGMETYVEMAGLDRMPVPEFIAQTIELVRVRVTDIGRLLIPGMYRAHNRPGAWLTLNMPLHLAAAGLAVFCWWRLVRPGGQSPGMGHRDVLLWSMPFYIGLYLIFPWDAGPRYFAPILAVLWIGICFQLALLQKHRYTILSILVMLHLFVGLVFFVRDDLKELQNFRRYWSSCVQLTRQMTPGEDVVAARGRRFGSVAGMTSYLMDRKVLYLQPEDPIAQNITCLIQAPATPDPGEGFTQVAETGELRLYRRRTPPGTESE